MVKEKGLAVTSSVSALLGVTEPAMFGVNLPLKYPFIAAIATSCVLGGFIGMNQVIGKVGVGGLPAIISIDKAFWGVYGIATVLAFIVPAVLTVIFAQFSNQKTKKMVK